MLHWQTFPTGVVLGVVGEVAGVGGAAGEQWVYPLTRFLTQKPFAALNALYLLAKVAWLDSALHVNSRVFLSHLSQIVPPLTAIAIFYPRERECGREAYRYFIWFCRPQAYSCT